MTLKVHWPGFLVAIACACACGTAAARDDARIGYVAPGWVKQEAARGVIGTLKWCGSDGERLIASINDHPNVIDLRRNATQSVAIRLVDGGRSLTCSGDGKYAFFGDSENQRLYMADTETAEVRLLYQTPGGASPDMLPRPDSVSTLVSPKMTYIIGGAEAPASIALPKGGVIKVLKSSALGRTSSDDVEFYRTAVWSDDERFLFWIESEQLTAYEPTSGKTYRRALGVEGFQPWTLIPRPGEPEEVYVVLIARDEQSGKEYKLRFLDPKARARPLLSHLEPYAYAPVAADGTVAFSRPLYPTNQPRFQADDVAAIPLAGRVYVKREGRESLLAVLRSDVQPLLSKDGKIIVYVEAAADTAAPSGLASQRVVTLRPGHDR